MVNYLKMYEELGYLFYALASAKKQFRKREFEILKEHIQKEWIPFEDSTDEFGTDAANYIYFTYDSLVEQDFPVLEAFNSFKTYFLDHSKAFDEVVRKKIRTTAEHMAMIAGSDKTGTFLIQELRKLLNKKSTLHTEHELCHY